MWPSLASIFFVRVLILFVRGVEGHCYLNYQTKQKPKQGLYRSMDEDSIDMDNEYLQNRNEIEESSDENHMSRADDSQQRISCADIQQRITHGIRCLDPLPNEACIFRVHRELRQVNEKAYTPMLVSIGPYHQGKPEYKAMEEHKKRYLDSVLKRTKKSVEYYIDSMIKLESRARNYYADAFDLGREKSFVEVMLLDGCFVIEFLRKAFEEEAKILVADDDDPIFKEGWMFLKIYHDLMLLENQLPFFLLYDVYKMITFPLEDPRLELKIFLDLVSLPVVEMLPVKGSDVKKLFRISDSFNILETKHFLDLVHKVCLPTLKEIRSLGSTGEICLRMPCVTELAEAGVMCRASEGGRSHLNMFDLKLKWKFENFQWQRLLQIPKLQVTDVTEVFFRNIIAYEQHSPQEKPKYFTDYTYFMDLLINYKEDVKQLCRQKIIENMLGDEEDVARMFNRLGDGRLIYRFYYSDLCKQVNAHCDRWWYKAKAKLNHDYFNSPWACVSTIAATFLLVFTFIQTLISINSFFNQ